MVDIDELQDMNVKDQREELENLRKEELEKLREAEDRQTSIDYIDTELSKRRTQEGEKQGEPRGEAEEQEPEHPQTEPDNSGTVEERDDRSVLEAKVDYLIENCKTTSMEGFQNYRK